MKTLIYATIAAVVALLLPHLASGASSEMEILLKKLQEKGILTREEAQEIAAETKKAAEEERRQVKDAAAKATTETAEPKKTEGTRAGLPDWIRNTKFGGDLRLRYENRDRDDDGRGSQSRGRFRLRLGATTEISDGLQVGFGLASGTSDQRSTNQTLGGAFDRKDVWIDTAYARYTPVPWFSMIGGKFVNPLWQPSDMFMGTDVNPEGAAMRLEGPVSSSFGLFFTSAFYVLADRNAGGSTNDPSAAFPSTPGGSPDPLMYVFQPGFKWNLTRDVFFRFAPAYYVVSNLKGELGIGPVVSTSPSGGDQLIPATTASSFSRTNTVNGAGKYRYNYSVINWGGELGFTKPLSWLPYFGLLGGYANNPSPSKDSAAYLVGFSVGSTNVAKLGDWALEYTFRRVEKDAWLDFLTDSSFYKGNTNVMGHRVKLLFGLTRNTALGLNFYDTWLVRKYNPTYSLIIPGSTRDLSSEEYLGQVDLIFRF